MSDKLECPGCGSYTSTVYAAYAREEPCPHCGLSHETMAELDNIRSTVRISRANDEVKAIAEAALQRAGKAEARADRLQRIVDAVREAFNEAGEHV